MARSLDQILAEVTARSDPQRNIVLGQISSLPTQQAADESSLAAKKDQAYEDITAGARRKGLGFSGIPLGEQAKYAATEYAPALANLKTSYGGRKSTLEMALADIGKSDYLSAQDIFARDRAFEYQQEQDRLNREDARREAASKAVSPSPTLGNGQSAGPKIQQRADKGFNFTDANGKAISAATYAQVTGVPFSQLLQRMAQSGDRGAQAYLMSANVTNPNTTRALTWR